MKNIFLIIIFLFFSGFITGCHSKPNDSSLYKDDNNTHTEDKKSNSSQKLNNSEENKSEYSVPGLGFEVLPLSESQFNEIVDDSEEFRIIFISITDFSSDVRYSLAFQCGSIVGLRYLAGEEFNVQMNLYRASQDPYYYCHYETEMIESQLNAMFNVLSSNADYFFNNEEFYGLELPVEMGSHLNSNNYLYTLIVVDNIVEDAEFETYHGYAISKNDDELEPGTPLYDLFQLIETEYIPILMQQEGDCW